MGLSLFPDPFTFPNFPLFSFSRLNSSLLFRDVSLPFRDLGESLAFFVLRIASCFSLDVLPLYDWQKVRTFSSPAVFPPLVETSALSPPPEWNQECLIVIEALLLTCSFPPIIPPHVSTNLPLLCKSFSFQHYQKCLRFPVPVVSAKPRPCLVATFASFPPMASEHFF